MGKLELLYNGWMVNKILIDFKNDDRLYAFHYAKDSYQRIIFSHRVVKDTYIEGEKYYEPTRLEIPPSENGACDRFLSVELVLGMINISYTENTKSSKDSNTYATQKLLNAYNFNYDDFAQCYVNTIPNTVEVTHELERLALVKKDV